MCAPNNRASKYIRQTEPKGGRNEKDQKGEIEKSTIIFENFSILL
jgi:hypothetical protein